MDGQTFLKEHISIGGQLFLPYAALPESMWEKLAVRTPLHLKVFTPDLLNNDFFLLFEKETGLYWLITSLQSRQSLPRRGVSFDGLQKLGLPAALEQLPKPEECVDISANPVAIALAADLHFKPGPAIMGRFPMGHDQQSKESQRDASEAATATILNWAEREWNTLENSRIFLSHKGVNKPLVEKIDAALRQIGLKTWLDKYDLPVGEALVRNVDDAFASCRAAVFFITGDYVDAGVIRLEIDRARNDSITRSTPLKIIPLVLRQYGGTDANVPEPLRILKWETVDDIDILPTIIRSIPSDLQSMIKYTVTR